MALYTTWTSFGGEPVTGYLAYPERARGPLPGVVVLQEAWGVDTFIEDVVRRVAYAGYAALAPDLYAQGGERPAALVPERLADLQVFFNTAPPTVWGDPAILQAELAKSPEPQRSVRGETFATMRAAMGDAAAMLDKAVQAARWLRETFEVTRGQKIGSVGFCMGGGLSAQLACSDTALGGAVVFYGMSPRAERVASIACPVLGLYGAKDANVNGKVPAFEAAMKAAGKPFERVFYEDAGHAFFNDNRPSYDVRASRDAWARTLSFFRSALAMSGA